MRVPKLSRNGDGRAYSRYPKSKGGKRIYFGKYGTVEAKAKYRDWINSQAFLHGAPKPKILVVDAVREYLIVCEKEWGRDSPEFNIIVKALERLLRLIDNRPVTDVGPRLLRQYCELMARESYDRKGHRGRYSITYISKCIARVKQMVRWACAEELIPPEHWMKLESFKLPRSSRRVAVQPKRVEPVPWVVVRATLGFLHEPVRTMVQIQYLCGMRPGEVCAMRAGDIDRDGDVWIFVPHEHKNSHRGQHLFKAIPRQAQALLQPYLTGSGDSYLFSPMDAPLFNPIMKLNEKYPTNSYRNAIVRACGRAQKHHVPIPIWRPGQLRHGIATEIKARFGHDAASTYLGHATPDVTTIYAERSLHGVKRVANQLEESLFATIPLVLPQSAEDKEPLL